MSTPSKLVVDVNSPEVIAERMAALIDSERGWINVLPEIPEDVPVPPTPSAFAVFSKRGPVVPMATWTAPTRGGRRSEPAQVGVQHGIARPVAKRLVGTSAEIPADWRRLTDHARRGLVVLPPPSETPLAIASWIFAVLEELCIPPHTTFFEAFVYEG